VLPSVPAPVRWAVAFAGLFVWTLFSDPDNFGDQAVTEPSTPGPDVPTAHPTTEE
jgi:hypothetical protein